MTTTAIDEARNIANALISGLANLDEVPTREQVEEMAGKMAAIFGYMGDLRDIVTTARMSVVTRMGSGVSLVDPEAQHDDEWVSKRQNIAWAYTRAFEEFMRNQGWAPQMVQSLGDVTGRILGHLQDPCDEGTWSRRGLVIGHVQSGKTANYIGLIARAADAGYKFIVVIAGIHNNLRKQTQQRIDAAFIGRSSDPDDRRRVGVGLEDDYPNPATLTNINDDFNKRTAAKSGWKLNDFSKPIILVIKKNVRTLDALYRWLKELNATGDGRIRDVPMLLIDDEADNASINTNKENLDPTRTNAMIRSILSLFGKSCYVGYTATPFANILINPDAYDEDVREELFPRDFIYCLDAPTSYFGARKVFLGDDVSEFVQPIDDCEEYLPISHKRYDPVTDLPPSLYRAIDEFIVARAIRNLRGQAAKHCSMMINVSRFVAVQQSVRDLVSLRITRLRQAVHANAAMSDEVASRNAYVRGLRQAFEAEYANAGFSWGEVKAAVGDVFDHLRVFVINSKSDEALDYSRYEREGIGLTAIAIGGLSLSRGLTIEGLVISYMYRNTRMYDTLMQMGRWFGYRPGYEDLCRVHLSRDSIDWYSYIADASEELIQQVKRMRRDRLSPKDFGLYVLSHPDRALLVTAANKMRSGEQVTFQQSFSGKVRESYIVSLAHEVNERNFALISEFWRNGFGSRPLQETSKGVAFTDVPVAIVDDFLTKFECHSDFAAMKSSILDYLARIREKHPLADVLLISPANGTGSGAPFTLRNQARAVGAGQPKGSSWTLNKHRVASRGDEKLALTDDQKREAEAREPVSDDDYRRVRNKPLLMIHSLVPKDAEVPGPVAAFGVSFPFGDDSTTINVVVNKVWLQKMQGYDDDPDDDEDYDD